MTVPSANVIPTVLVPHRHRRWFELSLRAWLILIVVTIVSSVQIASYLNASSVLNVAVRDREIDKAAMIGRFVEGLLATNAKHLRATVATLKAHPAVIESFAVTDPRTRPSLFATVRELQQALGLDQLELANTSEVILYRAHDPAKRGGKAEGWGVSEALAGQESLVLAQHESAEGTALLIESIAPVHEHGRVVGAVIAAHAVNDKFIAAIAVEAGADIALMRRDGRIVASSTSTQQSWDAEAFQRAFADKIPQAHSASLPGTTVLYVPIFLVDEAFVVQVDLNSTSAYRVFDAGSQHAAITGGLITVLAVIVALLMLRFALVPLRRLRQKTAHLVQQAFGEAVSVRTYQDELTATVLSLDRLTQHLVDQNLQLGAARDTALNASAAKSAFLSSMSHEIRTPLNGILGMADLLQRTSLNVSQRKYCDAIRASGRQLHSLLSDVLDLAKIEAGKLTLEAVDFDLHDLAADIGQTYEVLAAERSTALRVEVDPDVPRRIRGDPTRLRQILTNLIGNAVKFTEAGRIEVSVGTKHGPYAFAPPICKIVIADTGIGIARDKLPTLFSPFTQADTSTTRTHGGSGLGLAICRNLVQMMNGTIVVESEEGHGTTMTIELPIVVAEPAAEGEALASTTQGPLARSTVLVAEDNPVNQVVIVEMLSVLGLRCILAENGQEAVEAFESQRPDLILMDCQMPILDGYAAAARIRMIEGGAIRVPILALTANAFAEDRERCLAAGMDDHLTKPISFDALEKHLRRWIKDTGQSFASKSAEHEIPSAPDSTFDVGVLRTLAAEVGPRAVHRIVCTYIDTAPSLRASLEAAFGRQDLAAFRTACHSLKSQSRVVGAIALSDLAAEAEHSARQSDAGAFAHLPALLVAMDVAQASLNSYSQEFAAA